MSFFSLQIIMDINSEYLILDVKHVLLWQGCRDGVTEVGYYKKMPQNERNRNHGGITRSCEGPHRATRNPSG
jgi:hypothetical protein